MPQDEGRQIELLRVLCITSMMWVHVNPGLSTPTIVSTGEYQLIGTVFGNTLGRISVSLLSFISGYLIWASLRRDSFGSITLRRFRAVIVPILVWSAIFLALAYTKKAVTGDGAHAVAEVELRPWTLFVAWSGLTGPTANQSLFFLRDLFVSTLILRATVPLVERVPAIAALAALVLASNDALAPIVFRSSILQFMFFGAIAARLGYTIAGISRPLVALSLGYLMTVAGFAAITDPGIPQLQFLHLPLLLRRAGIGFLLLAYSAAFLALFPRTNIAKLGRHAFLAYLMHVPTMGILWAAWVEVVGDGDQQSYVFFYLGAPVVVFMLASWLGRALDRAPPAVQLLLRGKVGSPKRYNSPD
ncbi:acyltransferase family protein [Defluviimonas sp. SAOS-178_SWC]|uniref:acyltransferase family protein n=1 Tax=Defluviimonas sp. SAOS-178_SWC TaxID=3121287 RepID=UPI003221C792